MNLYRLLTTAAAVALFTGAANAQTAAEAPIAAEPAPATAAAAPAATPAPVATPAPAPAVAIAPVVAKGDMIETAKASGQFTVFLKALEKTNLTEVVKKTPTLTVFAPTDAAFAALPAGELDRLMKTENAQELQSLVVYHLVNAPIDSAKMKGAKGTVQSVAQREVLLDGSGETLKVNSANIVQADVRPTTGIMHVVDRVLSPTDPAITAAKVEAARNAVQSADAPAS